MLQTPRAAGLAGAAFDYAMRTAAVFTLTTSTLGHRLGVFPWLLTLLGLLVAVALLFVAADITWASTDPTGPPMRAWGR
ncbi:hypothetical protein OH809_04900 [Streptomyces sp. NBC_00873]|uniref:hypothetical protein n=1 Tax=unclassified Streptomyces TaxID=2593676 RepID=UPI00386F213A|nr:hypothetical protein OH809_04900 [Streptomyces sp. NBC_00873]WTA47821.1 hypothetical protein OH821_38890 [Streptomyces sp. NBC_00842]